MAHLILSGIAGIFLVMLFSLPLSAQHRFTLSIPGIEAADQRSTVQTPDGGFVLLYRRASYQEHYRMTHETVIDRSVLGLAKFTADGLVEWSHTVDIGKQRVEPVSLLQLPDGGFTAIANISDADEGIWEIALLHFNAHGYLLRTDAYDIDGAGEATDAIRLENGNIMITASIEKIIEGYSYTTMGVDTVALPVKWIEHERAIIVTSPEGDVLHGNHYPDLGYVNVCLLNDRPMLIGSIADTGEELSHGLVARIEPDGTVGEAVGLNLHTIRPADSYSVRDILLKPDGGFVLLVRCQVDSGMSVSESVLTLSFGPTWEIERSIENRKSPDLMYDAISILPDPADENGIRTIVGQFDHWNEYGEYTLQELGASGSLSTPRTIATHSEGNDVKNTEDGQAEASSVSARHDTYVGYENTSDVVMTDDQGFLLISSTGQAWYYNTRLVKAKSTLWLSRVSPDLVPCNGRPQTVDIGEDVEIAHKDDEEANHSTAEVSAPSFTGEEAIPLITKRTLVSEPIPVAMRTIREIKTSDHVLEPLNHCNDHASAPTASAHNRTAAGENSMEAVRLSPNFVSAGQQTELSFRLYGTETPDISILNIASGQIVRTVAKPAVVWSSSNGAGSATVGTDGLPAGIYLVRVQSGEKQLTAKLEVR